MKRKFVTLLLAIVMVVMTLPMTAISVFAAENDATEKNISLGTSAIANADRANSKWDRVYFGTYGGRQIKWLVLSTSGNGGSYTDANGDTYNASQNAHCSFCPNMRLKE